MPTLSAAPEVKTAIEAAFLLRQCVPIKAGEDLTAGNVCRNNGGIGQKAFNDTKADAAAAGILLSTSYSGQSGMLLVGGRIYIGHALPKGQVFFVSNIEGEMKTRDLIASGAWLTIVGRTASDGYFDVEPAALSIQQP